MANVSLPRIEEANWNTQFLTREGEIKNRSYFSRAIKWLLNLPLFSLIKPIFRKSVEQLSDDMARASGNIKAEIIRQITSGEMTKEDERITGAVAKINTLFAHISERRPGTMLNEIQLDVEAEDVEEEVRKPQPELSRRQRAVQRQLVLEARKREKERGQV